MHRRSVLATALIVVLVPLAGCDGWKSRQLWDNLVGKDKQATPVATPAPAPANAPVGNTLPYAPPPDDTRPGGHAPSNALPLPPASARSAPAEATRPFDFPTSADAGTVNPSICGFPGVVLPANAKLFAAGAYGGRELDFQIDRSGHEATQIEVAVNHRAEPVILMLGAYEPTVWNIGWSSESRIVAVLVSGYHRQVVAGLPKSVPTLVSSYDNKGACGYFYVKANDVGNLNPMAQRVFARRVDRVYPARDGRVIVGDSLPAGVALVTGNGPTPESFRDTTQPLAGDAGIEDAIRKGLLREATDSDARAWAQDQAMLPANRDLPPVEGASAPAVRLPPMYHAYVVLKPMVIPAGLYGAHSVTLFVPRGVPRPTGNPGHSRIYDFNTHTCAGATCRME